MASIELDKLWVHLADDPDTYIVLDYVDEQVTPARKVDVRTYAGGRRRSVTTPERTRRSEWSLGILTRQQLDTLDRWLGRTLMVRSPSGELIWGVCSQVPSKHVRKGGHWDAPLAVEMVTHTVEV